MNEKNTAALIAAAPLLYREHFQDKASSPFGVRGIECGDGWFQILLDLSSKIEPELRAMLDDGTPIEDLPRVVQVKEKFGGLRFYMNQHSEKWLKWIREAEAAARTSCECCGAQAFMHRRGGYLQILCPECAKKEGFTLAELEEEEQEIDIGNPAIRLRVAPMLKAGGKRSPYGLKHKARAEFMAARPLLMLNPKSPTNIEIAFPSTARPVMEHLADRLEAELRQLVDAGLPLDVLPVVRRFAVRKKTSFDVDIEPGTIPEEAEQEFDAAITEALVALTTLAGGVVELDGDA